MIRLLSAFVRRSHDMIVLTARTSIHPKFYWIAAVALACVLAGCTRTTEIVETPREPAVDLEHTIIPAPAEADLSETDAFTLTDATQIVVDAGDAEGRRIGETLAGLIGNTVETTPDVVDAGSERQGPHIRLTRGGPAQEGAYELDITTLGATLSAGTTSGLFYGIQTIRQLLPAYVEYTAAYPNPLTIPTGRISDAPRFEWRGAMLDVTRHFFPPDDVKRYIDHLAMYKMNRLHLHLSDDQGWRIEIPSRPLLTEIGASTQVGGGEGGYYSREAWTDLVEYAEERFVTLVPEIDMPGHTNAALASYPELTCDGEAPELYTGTEVGFSYLCVEKEETYEFVDDVVREITEVTPGPVFHLGGDEVHELTPEQYATFMERAQQIVQDHGKVVMGWDEIAEASLDLIDGSIVQVWRPQTEATARAVADAVAQGARVVMSPSNHIYIDMKYDESTVLGLSWAGLSDVRNAYDWDPAEFIPGVSESAIMGVEAPLWAETLGTISDVEFMAFPRLAGVAEIGWSPASARTWEEYRHRLGAQGPRWTALGINFYRAPEVPWQRIRR